MMVQSNAYMNGLFCYVRTDQYELKELRKSEMILDMSMGKGLKGNVCKNAPVQPCEDSMKGSKYKKCYRVGVINCMHFRVRFGKYGSPSHRFKIFWNATRLVSFGVRQFIAALIYFGVRRVSRRFSIFWIATRPRAALLYF